MFRTVLCDLPHDIRGFIKEDVDGGAVCVLNARLTHELNAETYLHEREHYQARPFVLMKLKHKGINKYKGAVYNDFWKVG